MEEKKKFNFNLLSSIFIYVVSGTFLVSSFFIEDKPSRAFPIAICCLSLLLATIFLILTLKGKHTNDNINMSGINRVFLMVLLILLYIFAIYLTGYYIASILYLPIGMLVLGQRNWKIIVGVNIGLMLFVYLFFGLLLSMQMPEGILF